MSQYPSPYSIPQPTNYGGFNPAAPYLKPARYAGMLMIISGTIGILLSLCLIGVAAMFPALRGQFPPQQMDVIRQLETESGVSVSFLFYVVAGVFFIPSLAFLILGPFVRRGGIVPIVVGIVLTALAVLFTLVNLGAAVFKASPPDACFGIVANVLLGFQLWWLIAAARNHRYVQQAQMAYQMQLWQYQQQAQAYAMGYQQMNPQPPQAPPSNFPQPPDDAPRS